MGKLRHAARKVKGFFDPRYLSISGKLINDLARVCKVALERSERLARRPEPCSSRHDKSSWNRETPRLFRGLD
jgi:hypothetical protein